MEKIHDCMSIANDGSRHSNLGTLSAGEGFAERQAAGGALRRAPGFDVPGSRHPAIRPKRRFTIQFQWLILERRAPAPQERLTSEAMYVRLPCIGG